MNVLQIPPSRTSMAMGPVPLSSPSQTVSPKQGTRSRGISAPRSLRTLSQPGMPGWGASYLYSALSPLTVPSDPPMSSHGMYSYSLYLITLTDDTPRPPRSARNTPNQSCSPRHRLSTCTQSRPAAGPSRPPASLQGTPQAASPVCSTPLVAAASMAGNRTHRTPRACESRAPRPKGCHCVAPLSRQSAHVRLLGLIHVIHECVVRVHGRPRVRRVVSTSVTPRLAPELGPPAALGGSHGVLVPAAAFVALIVRSKLALRPAPFSCSMLHSPPRLS